jgi:protein transport protein DSL1/ZW10
MAKHLTMRFRWKLIVLQGERCKTVGEILADAQGFINTTDQEQYDDCEAAISLVVQNIRRFSQEVKVRYFRLQSSIFIMKESFQPILPSSKYYEAIGSVVDAALSRMLNDILALSDITADESQKLSELCRIMNSLEGLFVQNSDLVSAVLSSMIYLIVQSLSQPSFVVDYVPSWLKFSYLSELLVSIAVDFSCYRLSRCLRLR